MRESTCDSEVPRLLEENDGSVTISECDDQYYKWDDGCNVLNGTPYFDRTRIGQLGPAVEGTYCCENTCNSSSCVNYSSSNPFIDVPLTNISLNASAGRNFTLDVMAYVTIGKFSMEELRDVEFRVVASNGTQLDKYICNVRDSPCIDNNYSMNTTTYEFNIFRIDPNNPTFYIEITFDKISDGAWIENPGPTFYITGNFISIVSAFYILHGKYLRQF